MGPSSAESRPTARLSVVVPILDEIESLPELCRRLDETLESLKTEGKLTDWELLFVDDGSSDGSTEWLRRRSAQDPRLRFLVLSRNFGHQAAIRAGLDHASGDAVVTMDADLQDPPELISDLIQAWLDGGEVIYAQRRAQRQDPLAKRVLAKAFYRVFRALSEVDAPLDTGDFRLLDRKVVDALRNTRETHLYLRGLTRWVGFRQVAVPYDRDSRFAGEAKYSTLRSARLALDALTSFSAAPMIWMTALGGLVALAGFAYAGYYIWLKLVFQPESLVPGWTTLLAAILILGGLQLTCLGMIGLYVGKIFEQTKARPLYLIRADYPEEEKVSNAH